MATAFGLTDEQLEVLLGGDEPDGWGPDDTAEVAAATARAQTALDHATALVAAKLSARYDWTASSGAPAVAAIVTDLALERLHGDDVPDGARYAARRSRTALDSLAGDRGRLLDAGGAEIAPRGRVRTLPRAEPAMGGTALGNFPRNPLPERFP
ncbi:MAG: hypothetical protein OXB97_04445 [Rhodospirillales bacterium]|nr:hypothetical protein [Rhodospirillales bacterium]